MSKGTSAVQLTLLKNSFKNTDITEEEIEMEFRKAHCDFNIATQNLSNKLVFWNEDFDYTHIHKKYFNIPDMTGSIQQAKEKAILSSNKVTRRNVDLHGFSRFGTMQCIVRAVKDLPNESLELGFIAGRGIHSEGNLSKTKGYTETLLESSEYCDYYYEDLFNKGLLKISMQRGKPVVPEIAKYMDKPISYTYKKNFIFNGLLHNLGRIGINSMDIGKYMSVHSSGCPKNTKQEMLLQANEYEFEFETKPYPGAWVVIDFYGIKVIPQAYSFIYYLNSPKKLLNKRPQNWVVESYEDMKWVEVDRRDLQDWINSDESEQEIAYNGKTIQCFSKSFMFQSLIKPRALRFRMLDENISGEQTFAVSKIDFFGRFEIRNTSTQNASDKNLNIFPAFFKETTSHKHETITLATINVNLEEKSIKQNINLSYYPLLNCDREKKIISDTKPVYRIRTFHIKIPFDLYRINKIINEEPGVEILTSVVDNYVEIEYSPHVKKVNQAVSINLQVFIEISLPSQTRCNSPIFDAISSDNVKELESLIEEGYDLEAKSIIGETPLIAAISRGNNDAASLLIKSGANTESTDIFGITPLLAAVMHNNTILSELLINEKCNMETADNLGNTPLLIAISKGLINIATNLIKSGANVEAVNRNGDYPLLLATFKNDHDLIKTLIEKGASTDKILQDTTIPDLMITLINDLNDFYRQKR